jgi:hypothetical protein
VLTLMIPTRVNDMLTTSLRFASAAGLRRVALAGAIVA